MIHIAFVMPDQSLVDVAHRAWKEHDRIFGKSPDLTYSVDNAIEPDEILSRHYDADVIVSRGGTAAALKDRHILTPVVEIPITSADMADSIRLALKKNGYLPIGVVGTVNTIRSVHFLRERFPVPIQSFVTASVHMPDLIAGMEQAASSGAKLILAGHNSCHYCAEHGIPAGLIYSSVESVFLAITEAKRTAAAVRVERENSMFFRGIVDNVFEGIIAVDKNGIIRTFNGAAEDFLKRRQKDCLGEKPGNVLPEGRLNAILTSGQAYTNEVVRIGEDSYVLNSTPIRQADEHIGMVVTFQAAQSITTAESRLRDQLRVSGHIARYHFEDILGKSPAVLTAIRQARRFARVDSNILLTGETGTGKELFAQSIHNESERASGPFVAVNCAAIPENLMESELFGYEGGAFTGASKTGKAGLFEAAHNGTIFLDEVSEIPLTLQSRLLRVIQEREIRRVGANRVIPINVRIICATNRDLMDMIHQGRFREDLYYRLKVLSINLPPLRSRGGDTALIMQHYLTHYARKFGKGDILLVPGAQRLAEKYTWPGNIREIRNVSEQLAVLCETDTVQPEDLAMIFPGETPPPAVFAPTGTPADTRLSSLEKQQILEVLAHSASRREAAEKLGISKTTLWRKCREFGLNP